MKVVVTIDHALIVDMIHAHLVSKLGEDATPSKENIKVLVRSKQNYRDKSWEQGELQVTYEGDV
jgi:hypothetical protein